MRKQDYNSVSISRGRGIVHTDTEFTNPGPHRSKDANHIDVFIEGMFHKIPNGTSGRHTNLKKETPAMDPPSDFKQLVDRVSALEELLNKHLTSSNGNEICNMDLTSKKPETV